MRIGLATSSDVPDWEVDDRPLHEALQARAVDLHHPVWDDDAVDWDAFDAVLIRTTWDYMERQEEFAAWAERVPRLLNPAHIVRWNTHKSYLRDLPSHHVAPTIWLFKGDTFDLSELPEGRHFIKPQVGATARETLRFVPGDPRAQAHLDRLLTTEDVMVQPYLSKVETEGEVSAIFIDGAISHCVRKIPNPGDYRVQDDFGAKDEPTTFSPAQRALAMNVWDRLFPHLLYGRVDLLALDDGTPVVTEVELVEPSLFFRHGPGAAERLADALLARVPSLRQGTGNP